MLQWYWKGAYWNPSVAETDVYYTPPMDKAMER